MTADFIAKVVESKFNQLNINDEESIYKFNLSITLLEEYLRGHFTEFVETELVYKWAKDWCTLRIFFENWYRRIGWIYGDKKTAEKKAQGYDIYEGYERYKKSRCY